MDLGRLIAERRKALGLTLEAVGNAVGVTKSTVKKWETGNISNMHHSRLPNLAKVLRMPLDTLIGECFSVESATRTFEASLVENENDDLYFMRVSDLEKPVGEVGGGEGALLLRSDAPFFNRENHEYGYYIMYDDSMINAGIRERDTVFFKPIYEEATDGKILLVKRDGDETHLLRRYYSAGEEVIFVAENPRYPAIRMKKGEGYRILGEAVLLQTKIE